MIIPRKVSFAARKKRDENMAFRTYLKWNAEEKDETKRGNQL